VKHTGKNLGQSAKSAGSKSASSRRPVSAAEDLKSEEEIFGLVLKGLRKHLGLSQSKLARRLGVSATHLGFLEANRRGPSLELLTRTAEVLGIETEKIVLLAYPKADSLRKQAWKEFKADKALLAKHKVTTQELQILEDMHILGRINHRRQFLIILDIIRDAWKSR
jgi:transcriptional regulator with XRE-family HTH domain